MTAQTALYFIHADHLNTPRALVDAQGRTVWKWENADPFGNNAPDEDPDADTQRVEFNLRLPGQYYDKETGLHYNYFRDYDPGIGRYVESDPIGLEGGINSFAYVGANPLTNSDPSGLIFPWTTLNELARPEYHLPQEDAIRMSSFINLVEGTGVAVAVIGPPVIAGSIVAAPQMCRAASEMAKAVKDPCRNLVFAATVGVAMCQGRPLGRVVRDFERKEQIRRASEQAGQKRIGNQAQYY